MYCNVSSESHCCISFTSLSQFLSPSLSVSHSSVCRPQLGCALEQMVWSVEQPRAVKILLSIGTEKASVQMQRSNIWQISVQSLYYSTQTLHGHELLPKSGNSLSELLKVWGIWEQGSKRRNRGRKNTQKNVACRHKKTPLSALCCLGVMQISSGCLSRLNRDQNRQRSNHYKAGRRSAATEKTENTQ